MPASSALITWRGPSRSGRASGSRGKDTSAFAHPLPIMVVIVARETAMETESSAGSRRRCIGLDVHREFAQVAIWQGGLVTQAGRFATTPEGVRAFADGLGPADEVALEATGNTWAIATLLASRAGRVVVSNPVKTRAIAEAKVKTDKVDAEILAQLRAADYLPSVWRPDPATSALRRQVLRRAHIVRQRTRLKNQVHAILHRNLIPRCPAADLFGHKGRRWLAEQELPPDELAAASALLRQLDFHAEELRLIDTDLGQAALGRTGASPRRCAGYWPAPSRPRDRTSPARPGAARD